MSLNSIGRLIPFGVNVKIIIHSVGASYHKI